MTFSELTNREIPAISKKGHKKWSSRGGSKIHGVIVHHWAGINGGIERLTTSEAKASVNYFILSTGEIIGSVSEKFRAWTSGSYEADRNRITIEVQNSTLGPDWKVSPAAVTSLKRLLADIHKRYNLTPSADSIKGHRDFAATACPGPFLYPLLPGIRSDVVGLLGETAQARPVPAPKPAQPAKTPAKTPAKANPSVLRVGVISDEVKRLQAGLARVFPAYRNNRYQPAASRGKTLVVDGIFGAATAGWVKEFQRRTKIEVDGIVGAVTRAKLAEYGVKL